MSWLGGQRVDLDSCGSTNDEAAALARRGCPDGTVVVAARQGAGRGRLGRSWSSPEGGAYLSLVMRPELPIAELPGVTLAAGIAVCDAARRFGVAAALKWPNDVVVDVRGPAGHAKLAGILVETTTSASRVDAVIIGVGLNVAPVELETATSLASLVDVHDVPSVIAAVLDELDPWLARFRRGGVAAVRAPWLERAATGLLLRTMQPSGELIGELAGLADDGALLLRDGHGQVHRVMAGEVAEVTTRR